MQTNIIMIDPKELRIGNLVMMHRISWSDGKKVVLPPLEVEINAAYITDIVNPDPDWADSYTPIPITPEWLERCGFEPKIIERMSAIEYSVDGLTIWTEYGDCAGYRFDGERTISVNSIHQLQNLYFALTGQELTVKQPETI